MGWRDKAAAPFQWTAGKVRAYRGWNDQRLEKKARRADLKAQIKAARQSGSTGSVDEGSLMQWGFFLFFVSIVMYLYDAVVSQWTVIQNIKNVYPGLNIVDLFLNSGVFLKLLLVIASGVFLFFFLTGMNKEENVKGPLYKTLFFTLIIASLLLSFARGGQYLISSILHLTFAVAAYFLFLSKIIKHKGYPESSAAAIGIFIVLIDIYGRSMIPFITEYLYGFSYFRTETFVIVTSLIQIFGIIPIWFYYFGFNMVGMGKAIGMIRLATAVAFILLITTHIFAQGVTQGTTIRVSEYKRTDLLGANSCTLEQNQELLRLYEQYGYQGYKELQKNTVGTEAIKNVQASTGSCIPDPISNPRLYLGYLRVKSGEKIDTLTKKAKGTYEQQIEEATGGYYEGEIDKAEKDEDLGVQIEEVEYAKSQFYPKQTSYVVAKVKGKSRDKPIPVVVGCQPYGYDNSGKMIKKGREGKILVSQGNENKFTIIGKKEQDFVCEIEALDPEARFVRFYADYEDEILSSLKTYFMNAETLNALGPDQDPLEIYEITDKKPVARNTYGPFIVGMETKEPPIGISLSERVISNPQLILGISLDNQWKGNINKINEMELQIPIGLVWAFCSKYVFMPKSGNVEAQQEGYAVYVANKDTMDVKLLEDIPEDSELKDQKANVNFFCTLEINSAEKILGKTPVSTKFFRLTVKYSYRIFKDFKVTETKKETQVDPSAFLQGGYEREDPKCPLKTKEDCITFDEGKNKFCYPEYEPQNDPAEPLKYVRCALCSDYKRECEKLLKKDDCDADRCRHLCYWEPDSSTPPDPNKGKCRYVDRTVIRANYEGKPNNQKFLWPTTSTKVESCYGQLYPGFKYGIDIKVDPDKEVYAIQRGVVTRVIPEPVHVVEIEHFPGLKSRYYFLKTINENIKPGEFVNKGDPIGKTGFDYKDLKTEGKILYFEIFDKEVDVTARVNPLMYNYNEPLGYYYPNNVNVKGQNSPQEINFKNDGNCCNQEQPLAFNMRNKYFTACTNEGY